MKKIQVVACLVLILLLQFILRIPFMGEPLEGDEGTYAYIAQGILRGEVPYQDTFDHKPPGIYFAYAAIFKVFGDSLTALRNFTAFYSLITTLAVFVLAGILLGSAGGLIAALFYAVFSNGPFLEATSSNTEVFMVLPMILAFLLLVMALERKSFSFYFCAGVLAGIASTLKQVAFFNFVVLLGFALWAGEDEHKLKNVCGLLLGFLLPWLGFAWYFYVQDAFLEFIDHCFLINFLYIRPNVDVVNLEWGRLNLFRIGYLFLEESILFILGTAATIYILIRNRERNLLLLVLWALSSCLGIMIGRYLFGHYFIQLLPALVILGAYAVIKWRQFRWPAAINLFIFAIFASLGIIILLTFYPFYLVYSPEEIAYARYRIDNLMMAREVAQIIKERTLPSDRILLWGTDPQVYVYAKRRTPGRYIYLPFHFPDRFEEAGQEAERIVAARMVKYIVLSRPVYEDLFNKIEKNYKYILFKKARFHGKQMRWGLFEIK